MAVDHDMIGHDNHCPVGVLVVAKDFVPIVDNIDRPVDHVDDELEVVAVVHFVRAPGGSNYHVRDHDRTHHARD